MNYENIVKNKKLVLSPSRSSFNLLEISILMYVILSFCIQYFTHIFASNSLLIISLVISSLILFAVGMKSDQSYNLPAIKLTFLWLIVLAVILFSYTRTDYGTDNYLNSLVTLFTFIAGISLLIFSGNNSNNFRLAFKAILFFALFYAISIWVQILMPSIYENYIVLLPVNTRNDVAKWASSGSYYTGFSSNPAFTAGHIVCGIFLLVSRRGATVKKKDKIINNVMLILLFASFLMTGKRAHLLFLFISLICLYILPHRGIKQAKKIRNVVIVLLLLLALFFVFVEIFSTIPVISRSVNTVIHMVEGKDVSSGRNTLYDHAWNMFLENPLFGIGWGNFRKSVIAFDIFTIEMETHNIYLQLLSETGIMGFFIIAGSMVVFLCNTLRNLRKEEQSENSGFWRSLLYYSFGYQLFILLYGLTGNVLYDPNFLMMYFFSCSINTAYILSCREKSINSNFANKIKI